MTARPSRSDMASKAQMIEAALTLFDQSLDLLTQQLPAALTMPKVDAVAPLPSLLEECEMRLDMVGQRRGPRLLYVMPGLPQLDPAWWRGRLAGVHCMRLPLADPAHLGQEQRVMRATIAGLWQQNLREGRDLLLLATPQTAMDLGLPMADQVFLVADPWLAFAADKTRQTTLQDLCLSTLRLIDAEPDLRLVRMDGVPSVDATYIALEKLNLAKHWRKVAGLDAPHRAKASQPDPDLTALAPAYAQLCARLGISAVPPAPEVSVASVEQAPRAERVRVAGLVKRIAQLGRLPSVPRAG